MIHPQRIRRCQMAKKEPAPKKTETLTLRLDPKTKFAIELLAREQKRTLAGVIEWAVQRAMSNQTVVTGAGKGSMQQLVDKVWSPDDLEKTIYLGLHAEHLLSYEEYCVWTVVKSNPLLIEIYETDKEGRIARFKLNRARIAYARDLIYQKSEELAEKGSVVPITLEDIQNVSGGAFQIWELLAKKLGEDDGETSFEEITEAVKVLKLQNALK